MQRAGPEEAKVTGGDGEQVGESAAGGVAGEGADGDGPTVTAHTHVLVEHPPLSNQSDGATDGHRGGEHGRERNADHAVASPVVRVPGVGARPEGRGAHRGHTR